MCLQTTWTAPKITRKDITVYKVLTPDNNDYSIAHPKYYTNGFQYKLQELYKTEIKEDTAYSSYDERAGNWRRELMQKKKSYKNIGQGFHSANTVKRVIEEKISDELQYGYSIEEIIKDLLPFGVYECTIPKGAEYYKDETGLLVSSQIIVQRQLSEKELIVIYTETTKTN